MKSTFFHVCKALGLFHLSRLLMRRRLLILCFHGVAMNDEAQFRPRLFLQESRFRQRLESIRRHRFPVHPLQDALRDLKEGSLPDNSIVITIDDGFYNALSKAAPLLHEFGLPATLYLISYYVQKRAPIFRLVVQYIFWKTTATQLDPISQPWGPDKTLDLNDPVLRERLTWQIIEYGETQCSEEERQAICRILGELLGVDYEAIADTRILSLLAPDELSVLEKMGIDVQLHTHRHRLPTDDEETCRREIRENRDFLLNTLGERKTHLCYPSGIWDKSQWPCLEAEGIESATTCKPGLNTAHTPRLGLYRILDQDDLSQIEFEAELFGFSELLRILSGKHRGR